MTEPATVLAPRPFIGEIQKLTCDFYGIPFETLIGASKLRAVARPRQVAMYLCCSMTAASTIQIGHRFLGRDHSTVIHARRQITKLLPVDDEVAEAVTTISACAEAYARNRIANYPEAMKARAA